MMEFALLTFYGLYVCTNTDGEREKEEEVILTSCEHNVAAY